jgi:hypothetical protein
MEPSRVTDTSSGDAVAVEAILPDDPRSPSRARRCVDSLDGKAHPGALAKARLLISEVVAAATAGEARGDIVVRLAVQGGTLRAEVETARAIAARPKGWGLLLVRRIAARWGVRRGTVWFEIDDA